jgi:DedD protein
VIGRKFKVLLLGFPLLAIIGCALLDDSAPKKPATTGLIATPPSYYSTAKARYLGGKYKENLDRIVERIVRNPKTSTLQFANNISSVGGIGFFTHSAAKTPDERYLEVVLATPETFETKGELSDKVHRLFSQYGSEVLGILSGDSDIYQDKELSGYGVNLAWRNILAETAGNRVTMARAIIYLPKDRVRSFLRQELNQNDLLGNAVIFSVEEDGPLTLVSYQPRETRPDFRPAIREDNLASVPAAPKATPTQSSPALEKEPNQKIERKIEVGKKEPSTVAKEIPSLTIVTPSAPEAKVEPKRPVAPQKNDTGTAKPSNVQEKKASQRGSAEQVAIGKGTETTGSSAPVNESRPETNVVAPKPSSPRVQEVTPSAAVAKAELQETNPVSPTLVPAKAESDARKETEEMRQEPSALQAPKRVVEMKKTEEEVKRAIEIAKPVATVTTMKTATEAGKPEAVSNEKLVDAAVAKLPVEKSSVGQQKEVKKSNESPVVVAKAEPPGPLTAPSREIVTPRLAEKTPEAKPREPIKTEAPAMKSIESPRPAEPRAIPEAPPARAEAQSLEMKAPTPAAKAVSKEEVANVKPRAPAPAETPKVVVENKTLDAKAPEKVTAMGPVAKPPVQTPVAEKVLPAPATGMAKADTPSLSAPRIERLPERAKSPEVNLSTATAAPIPAAKLTPEVPRPRATAKPDTGPSGAKIERPMIEDKPSPPVAAAPPLEIAVEKPAQQVALLRKPAEVVPEKPSLARPVPRALEGFIIQLGFSDKEKAQRWAETMERRGYAVSVTEAGAEGTLRVRLGNFALRDEAERQLRTFKQEGLSGIIINLPQGFRPEARSSIP